YYVKQSHKHAVPRTKFPHVHALAVVLVNLTNVTKVRVGRSDMDVPSWKKGIGPSVVACGAGVLRSWIWPDGASPCRASLCFRGCSRTARARWAREAPACDHPEEGESKKMPLGVRIQPTGHEGAYAHAVVDVESLLQEICMQHRYPCWQVPANKHLGWERRLTLPTRCLVRVSNFHPSPGRPWMVALSEVVSSAKRVPRIWNT
ncbi:hypothetical protein B0H13DRAFT_2071956, partial [Mycena leptocephala]